MVAKNCSTITMVDPLTVFLKQGLVLLLSQQGANHFGDVF